MLGSLPRVRAWPRAPPSTPTAPTTQERGTGGATPTGDPPPPRSVARGGHPHGSCIAGARGPDSPAFCGWRCWCVCGRRRRTRLSRKRRKRRFPRSLGRREGLVIIFLNVTAPPEPGPRLCSAGGGGGLCLWTGGPRRPAAVAFPLGPGSGVSPTRQPQGLVTPVPRARGWGMGRAGPTCHGAHRGAAHTGAGPPGREPRALPDALGREAWGAPF